MSWLSRLSRLSRVSWLSWLYFLSLKIVLSPFFFHSFFLGSSILLLLTLFSERISRV
jgi:hypothetical protein